MSTEQVSGIICQSCGMPMSKAADFGVNENQEYCCFCFQDGKFTNPDITMEQMITRVTGFLTAKLNMPAAKAEEMAKTKIPQLKRWLS